MRVGERVYVVLHQPRSPENVGAVARLMANFGLTQLVLSEQGPFALQEAERMAVKAGHVLAEARGVATLTEALAPCVWSCGSTSRTQLKGREVLSPEAAMRRLWEEAPRGPVALVLGGEKRGLSDEELALCADVCAIPTGEVQPSMNLAQAAAVLLYLCAREAAGPPLPAAGEPGARMGTVHALGGLMREALLAADYLNPQEPDGVLRELERSLMRAHLTQREAELWLSAFKHLARVARAGSPSPTGRGKG